MPVLLAPRALWGLMVSVPKPGTYTRSDEPWNEPVVVRIDAERRLYLNRQPVPPAELENRLGEALSRRGDWAVFVDEDQSLPYGAIAAVVDEIQGPFKAKVLLVTPRE
ncbi:MAG: ExbD/TolR family protein [Terriglobia bacterium]